CAIRLDRGADIADEVGVLDHEVQRLTAKRQDAVASARHHDAVAHLCVDHTTAAVQHHRGDVEPELDAIEEHAGACACERCNLDAAAPLTDAVPIDHGIAHDEL